MRTFRGASGESWKADVGESEGPDYKGRFFFRLVPEEGGKPVELLDVRWNSERTAARTLRTMSEVELQRRLRQALGRASGQVGHLAEGAE